MGGDAFRIYPVAGHQRRPLVDFMLNGLRGAGCTIIHAPAGDEAPFRLVLETPAGERIGVVMYLFRSTTVPTRNRPTDEARFQVKYGPNTGDMHTIFKDEYGLYVTIFAGIDLERGIIVSTDPEMHNPTRFFISIEYKNGHAEEASRDGWALWERVKRGNVEPIEDLVACTQERLLDLILFERAAQRLSPGHRQLLGERFLESIRARRPEDGGPSGHLLLAELGLDMASLLEVINNARRLKMAVRGGVAEHHLALQLRQETCVHAVATMPGDGQPDLLVTLSSGATVRVECKNCLRGRTAAGLPRVDFMRTRVSKADPCSRYYAKEDFEVLAACLHPVTQIWQFAFTLTRSMAPHRTCLGKLDNRVTVDSMWARSFDEIVARLLKD